MSAETQRIVLLGGGMGQELRRRSERPATPLWSAQVMLDEPQLVVAAHRDFIDAGARVIITNNYSATPQRLARDGDPALFAPLQAAALEAARLVAMGYRLDNAPDRVSWDLPFPGSPETMPGIRSPAGRRARCRWG